MVLVTNVGSGPLSDNALQVLYQRTNGPVNTHLRSDYNGYIHVYSPRAAGQNSPWVNFLFKTINILSICLFPEVFLFNDKLTAFCICDQS